MASPVEIILVPSLIILLGYFLKRYDVLKVQDSVVLSKIVLDVALPSLIFVNLSKATINSDMLVLPVGAFVLSTICMAISYLYCKSRGYSIVKTWTIMIASAMMNTGFLGFPISMGLFGREGFLNAIFFDLETTLIFVIFGVILVRVFGGNEKEVFKQSVKFVPLWAVLFALIFNVFDLQYGYVIENVLNYLGQATIPLIMITLGLRLDFRDVKRYLSDSLFVAFLKLILAPVLMFLILSVVTINELSFKVAILESGMATAMNALVLSINYDLDSELMSSMIFTNTFLALFTLAVLITFLI